MTASLPEKLDVHFAAPARHRNRSPRTLAQEGDEIHITAREKGYRLTFKEKTPGGQSREVDCAWDETRKMLSGSVNLDGDSFHVRAHLVEIGAKKYLSGIIIPKSTDGDPTDDPCETGGWTAQSQGGGEENSPL